MRNLKTYNLEHTNTVTNATGRRVWGYLGIEPLISPHISEVGQIAMYVCTEKLTRTQL